MHARKIFLLVIMIALLSGVLIRSAVAQSLVSGDVTGIVSDPSGAVVPNATVTTKKKGTGQTQSATSNAACVYRFSLLSPGSYTVTGSAQGFQNKSQAVTVAVGQAATLNLQLPVGSSSQTVEVTAEAGIMQAQNGNISTTFTPEKVQLVPNPGNDLSYLVQTAPGAVMNTQGGYGNDSTFGLPGTSNLFTVNGMNENDPFLNLNNSGATNLLLGQNDVQEATVVNNGYSGQYGQLAGANVNYVTKSGTNATGAATGIGCGTFSSPLLPAGTPCALQFRSTAGNFNREWLLTGRVDQNLGTNDRAFIHFRTDHGVQASYTDPLTSVFNAS